MHTYNDKLRYVMVIPCAPRCIFVLQARALVPAPVPGAPSGRLGAGRLEEWLQMSECGTISEGVNKRGILVS